MTFGFRGYEEDCGTERRKCSINSLEAELANTVADVWSSTMCMSHCGIVSEIFLVACVCSSHMYKCAWYMLSLQRIALEFRPWRERGLELRG